MPLTKILATVLSLCWAGVSAGAKINPPKVPENIKVPVGYEALLKADARGVQIYACRAGEDNGYSWKLLGPDALLFDEKGRELGRHYAGPRAAPVWQAHDGSEVIGDVMAKADAPEEGAIPWLLIKTRSVGAHGVLERAAYINRVNTVRGNPQAQCSENRKGAIARVDYSATYYFFKEMR